VAVVAAVCTPRKPPAPHPAPPLLAEASLPPSGTPTFEIGGISNTPSQDGAALFVQGTVRNTGTRASRDVQVWVEALDAKGTRVARGDARPTPQAIPPGTVGTFIVRLPNDPAIKSLRVEAIGR
jgi:hypothetical protein